MKCIFVLICSILFSSDCNNCIWCKRLLFSMQKKESRINAKKNIRTYFSPQKRKALQRIQNLKQIIKKKHFRATKKISKLENDLNSVQNKMRDIDQLTLNNIFENSDISKGQSELIKEIVMAAKVKNTKSRRYNENWMLLCMLFQIRYTINKINLIDTLFKLLLINYNMVIA